MYLKIFFKFFDTQIYFKKFKLYVLKNIEKFSGTLMWFRKLNFVYWKIRFTKFVTYVLKNFFQVFRILKKFFEIPMYFEKYKKSFSE